jgi:hypothetical protein
MIKTNIQPLSGQYEYEAESIELSSYGYMAFSEKESDGLEHMLKRVETLELVVCAPKVRREEMTFLISRLLFQSLAIAHNHMSECRNSLLRCIRVIAAEASTGPRPYLQSRIAPHARSSQAVREYSTESRRDARPRNGGTRGDETDGVVAGHQDGGRTTLVNRAPQKTYDPKSTWIKNNEHRQVRPPTEDSQEPGKMPNMNLALEKKIRKELQYLPDPLKLADHVRVVLKKGDVEKALGLTRIASKDMECIVSWNHIIGHLLSEKQVNAALKIYNEVPFVSYSNYGHELTIA